MKTLPVLALALIALPLPSHSQKSDGAAIKADIKAIWMDIAKGDSLRPSVFDKEHNLVAFSSGGLFEDLTEEEMVAALVKGTNTLDVKPYHINVTFFGAQEDVAYATYYLVGRIMQGDQVIVADYRTRISALLEKQNGKWYWVGAHASPLFAGSGVKLD